MSAARGAAAVHRQVMWNRLISVVEEQALSLVRTAFSTSVREAGDLSAGVFDRQGRMLAQAVTGTPGHVNTMARAVSNFIAAIGEANVFEGDAYLTNDPWLGTGHLHDITVVTPSFLDGTLIGYLACTAHVVDIGGRGFGPDANEIYEEGLFIPIMKLAERGRINSDLLHVIRHNVREADQVVGDIHSLASCNQIGHRRLAAMLDEFGLTDLEELAGFVFASSREGTRRCLARLPDGVYENRMVVDGYDRPVTLAVTLQAEDGRVHADFAGSSPASRFGINVPLVYTNAYAVYGLKCALAPEVPNNHASLEFYSGSAPAGCILDARHPSPVSVRHVIGHFVTDLVLGAVAEALPDAVPAEGAGALWNFHVSARAGPGVDPARHPPAEILVFNSGGSGARPRRDGLNATAFPSGVRTMPVEATEQVGPIVFWRKELRPDSGGAGRQRGGLGQVIELSPAEGYEFQVNAMFDRVDHPARGRRGGGPGAAGGVHLDDGTRLRAKGRHAVPAGRRLVLELPGGGGWGRPEDRRPEQVRDDIEQGYVSGMDPEGSPGQGD